jgi:hypothetical protein
MFSPSGGPLLECRVHAGRGQSFNEANSSTITTASIPGGRLMNHPQRAKEKRSTVIEIGVTTRDWQETCVANIFSSRRLVGSHPSLRLNFRGSPTGATLDIPAAIAGQSG